MGTPWEAFLGLPSQFNMLVAVYSGVLCGVMMCCGVVVCRVVLSCVVLCIVVLCCDVL